MKKFYLKLYKTGKFYNAYQDDALILHEIFNYKYNEIKRSAGFPETALGKIRSGLEGKKISYQIYEKKELKQTFEGIDAEYKKMVAKALKRLEYERRLIRIEDTLKKLTLDDLEKLLCVVEDRHLDEQQ